MIGRLVRTGAAGALVAATLLAPPASAQESVDSGEWAGSRVDRPPTVTSDPSAVPVSGVANRNRAFSRPTVTVTVSPAAGLPAGCPHQDPRSAPATVTAEGSSLAPSRYRFSWNAPFGPGACNGRYPVRVLVDVVGDSDLTLTTHIDVSVAPPPVLGVTAEPGGNRSVEVSWTPTADRPADFRGYRVIRSQSGAAPVEFTVDDPTASSFTDRDLPDDGGTFEYRVVGRRPGPTGGEVTSSGGEALAPVDVEPAPEPDDDEGQQPDGDGGGGDGGTGDGDGDVDGDGGGSGPGTRRPGSASGGGVRVPALGSRTSGVVPPLDWPRTTIDTGYSEELPFGDREPGGEDPVLPDGDELASTIYEDAPGRGLVVPVATGLVLAVWAFHLRYLARAARPE